MSATNKVFGTFELLEVILLQLPTQNLLHAQRVSTTWLDVIKGSARLQQALFFAPGPGKRLQFITVPGTTVVTRWSPYNKDFERSWRTDEADKMEHTVLENPLLSRILKQHTSCFYNGYVEFNGRLQRGSWEEMQVTSPPVSELTVDVKHMIRETGAWGYQCNTVRGHDGGGVTIGDVMDLVLRYVGSCGGVLVGIYGRDAWKKAGDLD